MNSLKDILFYVFVFLCLYELLNKIQKIRGVDDYMYLCEINVFVRDLKPPKCHSEYGVL